LIEEAPQPIGLVDRVEGTVFPVRVMPRAGRTGVAGTRAGALLVRLGAAPVDGAANRALVDFISDLLGVPRHRVAIVSGERSRDKRVLVRGLTALDVGRRLSAILSRD
jgi:uncharacterized protein (TIGR00251 family)